MESNGFDTRVIRRSILVVDTKRKFELSSQGIGQSHLTKGVDSKQEALNLSATAKYVPLT